jgi:hypothetical protein
MRLRLSHETLYAEFQWKKNIKIFCVFYSSARRWYETMPCSIRITYEYALLIPL